MWYKTPIECSLESDRMMAILVYGLNKNTEKKESRLNWLGNSFLSWRLQSLRNIERRTRREREKANHIIATHWFGCVVRGSSHRPQLNERKKTCGAESLLPVCFCSSFLNVVRIPCRPIKTKSILAVGSRGHNRHVNSKANRYRARSKCKAQLISRIVQWLVLVLLRWQSSERVLCEMSPCSVPFFLLFLDQELNQFICCIICSGSIKRTSHVDKCMM